MIGRIEAIHERGEGSFVTDTTTTAAPAAGQDKPSGSEAATGGALTGLRLPQLQAIALWKVPARSGPPAEEGAPAPPVPATDQAG